MLYGVLFSVFVYADLLAIFVVALKLYLAAYKCEQGIVGTASYIVAGMDVSSSLANENISREHILTVGALNAEPLGFAVASVLGRTHTFFMCKMLKT